MEDARDRGFLAAVAELALRNKVWNARRKFEFCLSYSSARTEEVLRSFELPQALAAELGLPAAEAAPTWLDALRRLQATKDTNE